MTREAMHTPVLLQETLAALALKPGLFVVDGTVDGGGHAAAILARIGGEGRLLGLDWDSTLLASCKERLKDFPNAILRHANYAELATVLEKEGLPKADAVLLDLGFSSEQLTQDKGLSFSENQPLRMTYSPDETPMHEHLRKMSEEEITEVIRELGEERYAKKIAHAIYARERKAPLTTTQELAELIRETVPGNYEHGRLNPSTRTFQAFRIYANDELGNLRKALLNLRETIVPGGRIAIISFHSLEDRIVKHEFKRLAGEEVLTILTPRPIEASEEEISINPRARSAKLRVAQML